MVRSALLLAAGLGTRLHPLTDLLPKCLAPIRGAPLLDYWLHLLTRAGVERVLVNAHHHADVVAAYLARSPWARKVALVHEDALLGTGGTLAANARFFRGSEPFLVAHADNLTNVDLRQFWQAHAARPRQAELTMLTFRTDSPSTCGIVITDARGLVEAFYEKVAHPPGNEANGAVYILERSVLDFACDVGEPGFDISTQLLPRYIGRMLAWHSNDYHRDVGTLQSWRIAQQEWPADLSVPGAPERWRSFLDDVLPDAKRAIEDLLADQ